MGAAVVGFIGVIVGALLSGTATFLMARRAEARQARAAARLLESELRAISGNLRLLSPALQARDNFADIRQILRLPPQHGWESHKAILAANLGPQQWYAVARAYESVDLLRLASQRDEFFLDDGRRVYHVVLQDFFVELAAKVHAGQDALARLAGNPNPQGDQSATSLRDMLVGMLTAAERPPDGDQQPKT